MKKLQILALPWLALAFAQSATLSAAAAERHFGFSYESAVLNPGLAEIQPWTTVRAGRTDYYSQVDTRLGFQLGLTKALQGTLFWNLSSITEDILIPGASQKSRLSTTEFESLSTQLKYKLSDPVADALGSALFVEGTFGTQIVGFEGRLILDKQLGSWLLALNVTGSGREQLDLNSRALASFGGSIAAGYFVTPSAVLSLEGRNETGFSGEIDRSVLYLGPSVSFAQARYWLTLAVQPQLVAFKETSTSRHLDLHRGEYLQTRLLLGFWL